MNGINFNGRNGDEIYAKKPANGQLSSQIHDTYMGFKTKYILIRIELQ